MLVAVFLFGFNAYNELWIQIVFPMKNLKCVGDAFQVIEENRPLLGMAEEGEVFEVTSIRITPNGKEAVAEYGDGREDYFSPTTLGEALGVAEYPGAPDTPCLERF